MKQLEYRPYSNDFKARVLYTAPTDGVFKFPNGDVHKLKKGESVPIEVPAYTAKKDDHIMYEDDDTFEDPPTTLREHGREVGRGLKDTFHALDKFAAHATSKIIAPAVHKSLRGIKAGFKKVFSK